MKVKKLTAQEFARAVQLGLGRAYLHVREFGDEGFEQIILDALLNNYVYDMQIEGERSGWLMCLVVLTARVKFYASCLDDAFKCKRKYRSADLVQHINECRYLFELGFEKFKPIMFDKFETLISSGYCHSMCGLDLVEVGGLPGLLYVATRLGAGGANIDEFVCGTILEEAEDKIGQSLVAEYLKLQSDNLEEMRNFMEACDRHKAAWSSDRAARVKPIFTLAWLVQSLAAVKFKGSRYDYVRFGNTASNSELELVFAMLLKAKGHFRQIALLDVFGQRPMPTFDLQLLNFIDSPNAQVRWSAAYALARINHPAIRLKAMELIQGKEEVIPIALQLLQQNYLPEDAAIIFKILKTMKSSENIHSAGMYLRDITEHQDGKDLADCFLWLFENGPDSFCRSSFFEQLINWGQCPPPILYECQWDSRDQTQQLARGLVQ